MPELVLTPAPVSTQRRGWRSMNSRSVDIVHAMLPRGLGQRARDHDRMPAALLREIRRALFAQTARRLREQVAVAEPGQRALQGRAVIVQRNCSVFLAFHVGLQRFPERHRRLFVSCLTTPNGSTYVSSKGPDA